LGAISFIIYCHSISLIIAFGVSQLNAQFSNINRQQDVQEFMRFLLGNLQDLDHFLHQSSALSFFSFDEIIFSSDFVICSDGCPREVDRVRHGRRPFQQKELYGGSLSFLVSQTKAEIAFLD